MDMPAHEVGLHFATSNTRSNGVRLVHHRPISKKCAVLFSCRMPPIWNTLPINILQAETPIKFKKLLYAYFLVRQ